jgi:tRNA-dihydrouridine synthase B
LVTLATFEEVSAVLDEVATMYAGYEIDKTPIELINYHEKCPVD